VNVTIKDLTKEDTLTVSYLGGIGKQVSIAVAKELDFTIFQIKSNNTAPIMPKNIPEVALIGPHREVTPTALTPSTIYILAHHTIIFEESASQPTYPTDLV
jgi:hypothetical protein